MIEKTVLDYLKEHMIYTVSMETPDPLESEYILIERVGGGESNHIKNASIAFQSYADTLYRAAQINEEVKETMKGMRDISSVASVRLESDYNFTDTTTKKYRYQSIFRIVYY